VGGILNSSFLIPNSLYWVGDIYELDIESVVVRDPSAESADTETLGCVMARGYIVDTVFCRLVHDPLGGLTGHIGIESGGYRLVKLALSAAGHDAHRRHLAFAAREDLGLAIARLGDGCEKFVRLDRLREDATHPGGSAAMHSEAFEFFKPEATGQLGGIAQLEVTIQRQVVGDQRNPVLDQEADALPE